MSTSEQHMRQKVVKALKPLDAISVENPARPGTPDVNYIPGWLELKKLDRWPKNADKSPVLIPHYTPQQRVWIKRRWRLGGPVFLLLQVGRTWLLFEGDVAATLVGHLNRSELEERAYRWWPDGLNEAELLECLRTYGSD